MRDGKAELICREGVTVNEINNHWKYKDKKPGGAGDDDLVSCGQKDTYNELEYILGRLVKYKGNFKISEKELIKALCECCNELESPRDRTDFYRCLKRKTGIDLNS